MSSHADALAMRLRGKFKKVSFLLLLVPLLARQVYPQQFPADHTDDSDWWSLVRDDSRLEKLSPQPEEIAASNFEIAGVTLDSDQVLDRVPAKLGRTAFVSRGDASTARSQLCYASSQGSKATYLIFESGEVELSFYLFAGGRPWNGQKNCAHSPRVRHVLATASGLRLGLSRSEIEGILGKPTSANESELTYWHQTTERSSARDMERARKENPHMSDKEFHESYDYFVRSVCIIVKFKDGKANYIGVSKSETD
jgi:hypothetical protein